jgi:LysR family transcriptional regulator, carnitine catabolism transcriptional activator
MIDFTSRQLRAFALVAQHRSFTRAAEALFITPSGLSVLIRELEAQLGFRLFDRTTRSVTLTKDGAKLLATVRRNLQELDAAMSRIGQDARAASQSFSFGAPPLIAANILAPAIKEFHDQRPDLRVRLVDGPLNTLRAAVESGKVDAALGTFDRAPGLRRTPFFRFALMVVRPEQAPARGSVTWSALKGETLISLAPESPTQRIIDRHLADAGVTLRPDLAMNSLDALIAMVEAGHGIGIIPAFGLPVSRSRRVVMTRLTNPVVTVDLHQIQHRGRKPPPGAEDFTGFIQGYFARWVGTAGIL